MFWCHCVGAGSHTSLLGSDTVPCVCLACRRHVVEHMAHPSEGPGGSLGSAGAGGAGEVICLPGLVCLQDGMFQVPLGQPEVILWSTALEVNQEFWSLVWANQSVGKNIFDLELFSPLHQLWGVVPLGKVQPLVGRGGRVSGSPRLEWSESDESWWDLHSDSVGSSELQHFEGS